jgi:hypothetical protein
LGPGYWNGRCSRSGCVSFFCTVPVSEEVS